MLTKTGKQVVAGLLTLALALSVCGCAGDVNKNTTDGTKETNSTQQTENTQTQPSMEATSAVNNQKTVKIPGYQVYFSYSSEYVLDSGTYSKILRKSDECLVAVYYNWKGSFDDPADMIPAYSETFMRDVSGKSKGNLLNSKIETTSVQNGSVAGYDCVVFDGKTYNRGEWECHLYGYALTIGEVNIMVIGLVSTKAQDAQMIADTDALTDQIAATLRIHE